MKLTLFTRLTVGNVAILLLIFLLGIYSLRTAEKIQVKSGGFSDEN